MKRADQGLRVTIDDGRLVISIGVDVLCFAAESCARFYDGEVDKYTLKITNKAMFARDVLRMLEREQEDGTTPVHTLLDNAFEAAVDDGCEWATLTPPRPAGGGKE